MSCATSIEIPGGSVPRDQAPLVAGLGRDQGDRRLLAAGVPEVDFCAVAVDAHVTDLDAFERGREPRLPHQRLERFLAAAGGVGQVVLLLLGARGARRL